MITKMTDVTCPCCGGSNEVTILDWDQNGDYLIHEMYCGACDSYWTEYYKIIYDGYCYDEKEYDAYGREMPNVLPH